MSQQQVLAGSATMLTESGNGEKNFPFGEVLTKIASIKSSGNVTGGSILKRTNLISSLCSRYRASFSAIYSAKQALPKHIHERICNVVDAYIGNQLQTISVNNATSLRLTRILDNKTGIVTLETKAIGSDSVTLEHALTTIEVKIEQAETRLQKLMEKLEPDYDAEKKCEALIEKLQGFHNKTLQEIKAQNTLTDTMLEQAKEKEMLELKAKYQVQ